MTDPTVIAASIVTVIAAVTTGIVTVINAAAAARDRRNSREERHALAATAIATNQKADTIIEKAVEIHTLTNGTTSKLTTALDVANERIAGLQSLNASLVAAIAAADVARAHTREDIAMALATPPPVLPKDPA